MKANPVKPDTEVESSGFRDTLRGIDDYWFGRGSPTALGIFRILVGALSLANMFLLGLHWESWFGEKGYAPDWLTQIKFPPYMQVWDLGRIPKLNLLNGITDPRITIPAFCIIAILSLMTAIGVWTKFSTVALAIGVISLQYRDTLILHGGDSVIRLWCIYLAVSPCGKACSVDRLIGLWKGKIAPGPVSVSLWPQRVVTFNLALIYFTTIWLKWDGDRWRTGIATYFPARLPEFFRFPYPRFFMDMPFVRIPTYGTLLVEFSMGTLVFFRPLRKYVLAGGLMMHGWIEYSMNIPLFSFLMCSAYVCFYDGEEIEEWARRVGRRLHRWAVTILLPAGKTLDPQPAALLNAVDPFGLVEYRAGPDPAWTARRTDGSAVPAVRASWSRSVGAWIFAWLPGVWARLLDQSVRAAEPVAEVVPVAVHR
jgi:hypothetical protein